MGTPVFGDPPDSLVGEWGKIKGGELRKEWGGGGVGGSYSVQQDGGGSHGPVNPRSNKFRETFRAAGTLFTMMFGRELTRMGPTCRGECTASPEILALEARGSDLLNKGSSPPGKIDVRV